MHKIKYFAKGKSICGSDFENRRQCEYINLSQISTLSDVKKFNLPLSGTYVGKYSIIAMGNGDSYYIDINEFNRLTNII